MAENVSPLAEALRKMVGHPLVAVGSGGSLSAAKLAAFLHQLCCAGVGKSATPLEVMAQRGFPSSTSVLLLSAGGANSDILGVFRHVGRCERHQVISLVARRGCPLSLLAQKVPTAVCLEFEPPCGRDGFLATSSLVAFSVVLAKAYDDAFGASSGRLAELERLAKGGCGWKTHVESLREQVSRLWSREHLVVLYPPEAEPGATDVESKFTEAALGSVHIADYRHFAHGRHHWLAKRGDDSAVLAFVTPRFQELADATLDCLPRRIPTARIELPEDPVQAALMSVLNSIILAGCVGQDRRIDPGRPGVPAFGRKVYHLSWRPPRMNKADQTTSLEMSAVAKKRQAAGFNEDSRLGVRDAYREFCGRLGRQRFKALVMDYDGTMVSTADRFEPLSDRVATSLAKLLRGGVVIGVASGRGKSLRAELQKALPQSLWSRVVLGYYNGGQTGLLIEDSLPVVRPVQPELDVIRRALEAANELRQLITIEARPGQLSVAPKLGAPVGNFWQRIMEVVQRGSTVNFKVVCSGHSVDILSPGTTKLAVVERVRALAGAEADEVLRIGDQGAWPGNDFDLLAAFPGLSVDEVSTALDSCWNLSPCGCTGPDALGAHLDATQLRKHWFRLDLHRLEEARP